MTLFVVYQVEIRERGAAKTQINQDDLLATFTPESVRPFTFPVFVSPDRKEDIVSTYNLQISLFNFIFFIYNIYLN